ncbi:Arogenate dehydratase prephenate dehydratase chloroplastic [Chlorella sorokiniana]|uniref:Arogenate dehydratase n=1 Tax=Chlorella sorokiniana TaxID=3076 RepID=A0A2P6U5A5_CHLSO|nr:Arogenate dehydratase prephenate dehydratase chloroplastic [Chlorella sorokiniana]|eukprot:PRW61501.1 Arogenate dehydratase prephenate dehydratase chloroplastic [Chlorella sorokiniana]
MASAHGVSLTAPIAGCAPQRRQQPQPAAASRGLSLRCQAAGSMLEAPSSSSAAELGRQAAERMASGAAAGPRPSTAGAASSPAGSGSSLRGLRGSRPINLGPGGVLTSDLIVRATGSSGLTDEGYHPINRVAYQGVPGAYSEMAALKACPGWEPLPCEQFETAFQALSQWMAERATLPVENSLGGSIHAVYDLLLRYRLHIVGEVSVAVRHCLLALPGVEKGDIKRVLSHPQALAQTDSYTRRMPGVVREAVDDTAGAAKMIADNDWRDAAAVASRRAGELYGLNVLDEDIQDMKDNVTRFVVLSRDPLVATDALASTVPYKTSIVFSLQEGPGMLFKALSVFALRDIDMTKIESRPMRANPLILSESSGSGAQRSFNYLFYIDFVGSLADPQAQNALRHLQEIAPFLRVLGSYPMDTEL